MAGASGAIIIRQDGTSIDWTKHCSPCGYTEPGYHKSQLQPYTVLHAGTFSCPKCRAQTPVVIYG
jgi:predicted nucleic-acid-binding Zn-ribbon protein